MATLAGVLAAVLLPLSLVSVWLDGVVSDTDTYVDTVAPLADDDVVKAAAITELQREALALVGSRTSLPPGAEQLVHLAVQRVVDSPAFRTAWVQANRTAHDQVVAVLESRSRTTRDDHGQVTIELGPVLHSIAVALAGQGLINAGRADHVDASIVVMDAGQLAKARRAYAALDTLGLWLPVIWAGLVLLTLLLARRRVVALVRLAVASLVALGLLALGLVLARGVLTHDLAQRDVARAVWDVVVAGLWHELEGAAVALVVVVVVAVLATVATARRGRAATPSGSPDGAQQDGC